MTINYKASFLRMARTVVCPVKGCKGGGGATSRYILRVNFVHHRVQGTIVILENGNCPHPRY